MMTAQPKRICILMIKVNKLFPFLSSVLSNGIEKASSAFLLSYRNTYKSLGKCEILESLSMTFTADGKRQRLLLIFSFLVILK